MKELKIFLLECIRFSNSQTLQRIYQKKQTLWREKTQLSKSTTKLPS